MAGLVLVIRSVHANVDGFAVIGKVQIFQMDVAAVDTDSHPASVNGNAFLIKSGIVNQNGFLFGIVEKSSGSSLPDSLD